MSIKSANRGSINAWLLAAGVMGALVLILPWVKVAAPRCGGREPAAEPVKDEPAAQELPRPVEAEKAVPDSFQEIAEAVRPPKRLQLDEEEVDRFLSDAENIDHLKKLLSSPDLAQKIRQAEESGSLRDLALRCVRDRETLRAARRIARDPRVQELLSELLSNAAARKELERMAAAYPELGAAAAMILAP